jgi:hypothetical protein
LRDGTAPVETQNVETLRREQNLLTHSVRQRTLRPGFPRSILTTLTSRVSKQAEQKTQGERTPMKRALGYAGIVLLVAMASIQVFAQANPLFGAWKLNVAKSKYTGMPAPKEMTRVVEPDGDKVKYTNSGIAADGSSISFSFTVKYDGKEYPITGLAPYGADMIAVKRVNANTYEATLKKGPEVVATTKIVVSKDGKVTTLTAHGGADPSKNYVAIYDKQ